MYYPAKILSCIVSALIVIAIPVCAQASEDDAGRGKAMRPDEISRAWAERDKLLSDLHARVIRLDADRAQAIIEKESLEAKLDRLSAEIVELKSRSFRRFRRENDLNRALQRSREISARLDTLSRRKERMTSNLLAAARTLADAYGDEISALRREMEILSGSDSGLKDSGVEKEGRKIIERIARMETERRNVMEGISRLQGGDWTLDLNLRPLLSSSRSSDDDPEELLARADMLKDTRDRLVRRLGEVERKATVARQQRELEREMDGFLAETRFFDEGDRAVARLVNPASGGSPVRGGGRSPAYGDPEMVVDPPPEDIAYDDYDGGFDESAPTDSYDRDIGAEDPVALPDREWSRSPDFGSDIPGIGPPSEGPGLFQLDRITGRAESGAALDALLSLDAGRTLEEIEAFQEEIERLIRRLERRAAALERRAEEISDKR